MKATPTSALVVPEAKLLLEVLVIALDPPAQLGGVDQGAASDVRGQCGQKILCRLEFARRPFDQTPFLGTRRRTLIVTMCGANSKRCGDDTWRHGPVL